MKHPWIFAAAMLIAGCGQTGALYLPDGTTESPILIRPMSDAPPSGVTPTPAPESARTPPAPTPTPATIPAAPVPAGEQPTTGREQKPAGTQASQPDR